jgi:hypothetical protein
LLLLKRTPAPPLAATQGPGLANRSAHVQCRPMWARGVAGVVMCVVGDVWIAQGTDALHGSGMSGQGQWAVIGVVVALIGFALLAWAWRIRIRRS